MHRVDDPAPWSASAPLVLMTTPRGTGAAITLLAAAVVGLLVVGARTVISLSGGHKEPPPDEDAYAAKVCTSKFDVPLPKRPFIEEGCAACELLRQGYSEEEAC